MAVESGGSALDRSIPIWVSSRDGGGGSYPSRKRECKSYPRVGRMSIGGDVGGTPAFLHQETTVLGVRHDVWARLSLEDRRGVQHFVSGCEYLIEDVKGRWAGDRLIQVADW